MKTTNWSIFRKSLRFQVKRLLLRKYDGCEIRNKNKGWWLVKQAGIFSCVNIPRCTEVKRSNTQNIKGTLYCCPVSHLLFAYPFTASVFKGCGCGDPLPGTDDKILTVAVFLSPCTLITSTVLWVAFAFLSNTSPGTQSVAQETWNPVFFIST